MAARFRKSGKIGAKAEKTISEDFNIEMQLFIDFGYFLKFSNVEPEKCSEFLISHS